MKLSRKERREGNKRKEAGKSGRKERGRRGGGREESVPLNSCRVLFLPCRLSPALELKRGSLWHQRLSLWFLFPAPAGTQTSLKWVFGFWDSLPAEEPWTAGSAHMELFSQAKWQALRITVSVRCIWDISTPSFTLLQRLEDASKGRVLGWFLLVWNSWAAVLCGGCSEVSLAFSPQSFNFLSST